MNFLIYYQTRNGVASQRVDRASEELALEAFKVNYPRRFKKIVKMENVTKYVKMGISCY
jgi:hypothetical protein